MKFTEEKLEQAVIELFEAEDYKHLTDEQIQLGLIQNPPIEYLLIGWFQCSVI